MPDLHELSIEALSQLVHSRQVSPVEVTDHFLERVDRLNPSINAFVALAAVQARAEAASQTYRLSHGGDPGPLCGLLLGVKDLENAAGFVTTGGSRVHAPESAARDSIQVARLRRAGAIVLGKTNTPEFGHLPYTTNDLFGPTRNPWNLERTPGGSSGGSAAAIAASMVPLATGSDGGGSIRTPAAFTGLYGLKPARGRIPMGPSKVRGFMDVAVVGPITHTVRDAALLLDITAGHHPADGNSLPDPPQRFLDTVDEPLPPLRIGFNRTFGNTGVEPDIMREFEAAVRVFEAAGHHVEEDTTELPEMAGWWILISFFQALALSWESYATRHDDFTELYRQRLDESVGVDAVDFHTFLEARGELDTAVQAMFERYDLLLTPTVPVEAFNAEGPQPEEVEGIPSSGVTYPYPFNFTGHPAASIPAGFTDSGLPAGLQIVGPHHREDLVLRASRLVEQTRPWPRWVE